MFLQVTVAEIQTTDISGAKGGAVESKMTKASSGVSFANSVLTFEKGEGSAIVLTGKSKGKVRNKVLVTSVVGGGLKYTIIGVAFFRKHLK